MIPTEENNLKIVFDKLYNTIDTYKLKYPELMYLEKQIHTTDINPHANYQLESLVKVCEWLKDLVMQYYVFRIIQHRLEQDIASLQQGTYQKGLNKFYLEFAEN